MRLVDPEDLHTLSPAELRALLHDWSIWARPAQLPPDDPRSSNHLTPNTPNLLWEYWLALAGRGWGKALDLDTPIYTREGWKTMGTLSPTDQVLAPDGTFTRITLHEPYQPRRTLELVFSDGQRVVADEDHLWATIPREQRRRPKADFQAVRSTREIEQTLRAGKTANHFIPSALPLNLSLQAPPLDPYLLGYWLGDGSSKSWRFTILKEDFNHFQSKLPSDVLVYRSQDASPRCWDVKLSNGTPPSRDEEGRFASNDSLHSKLKALNLYNNKHIPEGYLQYSLSDRLELLRGLMDSDGSIDKSGVQARYHTTSLRLADQAYGLISSLGYVVTRSIKLPRVTGKPNALCRPCHVLRFRPTPELNPFSLPRKAVRVAPLPPTQASKLGGRFIIDVREVPQRRVRCITVEHPSRLYLITNSFIATHNTRTGAEQVLRWVRNGYRRIGIIAPTSADTRDVATEGESGILTVAHPKERPLYEPSKRRLTFPNGAIATLFSAEEPERLRGPQHDAIWMDEMAGWQYPQETWDMAMFGLRLGLHPQVFISTTPKPIPLIRSLIIRAQKEPEKVVLTTGSTYENRANLAKTFFTQVAQYEGTRLGDQELHAKIIDPRESGIIRPAWFRLFPASTPLPKFEIILQSYDTAFTEKTQDRKTKDPDPSAQTTWGVFLIPTAIRLLYSIPNHIQYAALLLDGWTDHLSYPNLREKVQKEYRDSYYGPKGDERRADIVLIEDKGSGISLRQDLALAVPVRPYNPGRADKVQRLHAVSNLPCQGVVFVPESRLTKGKPTDWADMVIDQVCSFPLVEHDDIVDTFSQALQYLKDQGWLVIDPPEEEDDDYVPERRAGNPYAR